MTTARYSCLFFQIQKKCVKKYKCSYIHSRWRLLRCCLFLRSVSETLNPKLGPSPVSQAFMSKRRITLDCNKKVHVYACMFVHVCVCVHVWTCFFLWVSVLEVNMLALNQFFSSSQWSVFLSYRNQTFSVTRSEWKLQKSSQISWPKDWISSTRWRPVLALLPVEGREIILAHILLRTRHFHMVNKNIPLFFVLYPPAAQRKKLFWAFLMEYFRTINWTLVDMKVEWK